MIKHYTPEAWAEIKPLLDQHWPGSYQVLNPTSNRVSVPWLPLGATRDDYLDAVRYHNLTVRVDIPAQALTWLALIK